MVERLTLDFSPGYDLTVGEFEARVGLCADSVETARDSLSLSLSAPPPPQYRLSKYINIKKRETLFFSVLFIFERERECDQEEGQRDRGTEDPKRVLC